MKITILTMFPEMLESLKNAPVTQHAQRDHLLDLETVDIREYAGGSFRHIDDSPYGGGAGMIIRCQPVLDALKTVQTDESWTVIPSPCGKVFDQKKAHALCHKEHLILIAGHYEGIDQRVYGHCDETLSLGDYILSSGEYACMVIADAVIRLLDGVMKKESTEEESFENGLLEYPQYTRPESYEGERVPDVLLSGNHEEIRKWRLQKSMETTLKYRPDLLEKKKLNEEEEEILHQIRMKNGREN